MFVGQRYSQSLKELLIDFALGRIVILHSFPTLKNVGYSTVK